MTRACTSVPSINRNAMITQNQETTSRHTLSLEVACSWCYWRAFSTRSRSAATASSTSAFTMSLHFELHQLGRIAAGVARRAKFSLRVLYGGAQRFKRKIPEKISAQELADILYGIPLRNQFIPAGSLYTVIAGRNCGR